MIEDIIEKFPGINFMKIDGFDNSIIGYCENPFRIVYSFMKIIEELEKRDLSHDEAIDYFYFNIDGCNLGEKTPLICFDFLKKNYETL